MWFYLSIHKFAGVKGKLKEKIKVVVKVILVIRVLKMG